MASAVSKIRLTCPKCDEEFRVTRPEDGARVKCPECGKGFVPELDDEEEASGVQERPTLKVKGKAAAKADPDEKPRSKKSRAEDAEAPKKSRRRDEDDEDEDDDDDDDRPSKKKKGKEKASGSNMLILLLVLLGGGFVLSLGLLAVGAFVWPGFMRSKPDDQMVQARDKGAGLDAGNTKDGAGKDNAGKNNPPAFLPGGNNVANFILADADLLIGANVKAIRDANQLEQMLKQLDAANQTKKMPAEVKELIRNSETVMLCMQIPDQAFQKNQFQPGGAPPFGGPPGVGGQPGIGGQPFVPPGGGQPVPPGGVGQPGLPGGGQPVAPGGIGQPGLPGGGQPFPPGGVGQPGLPGGGQPFPPGGVGQGGPKVKVVIAVLASSADAVKKIKGMAAVGAPQLAGGGKYAIHYPIKNDKEWPEFMAFPGDRTILLGSMTDEKDITTLLDQAAKNQGSANELVRLGAAVDKGHFWGALKFNDKMRQSLKEMEAAVKQMPEMQGLIQPLQRAKGASMSYDVINNGAAMRLLLNVECADANDAAGLRKSAEPLKDMAIGLLQLVGGKLPQSVTTDLNTISFQNQGAVVSVSMQVTEQSILALAKLGDTKKSFPGKDGAPKDFAKNDGFKKDLPTFDGFNKDRPKLDGFNKDFPKFDGSKKDFPTPDGFKKDFPTPDGSKKDFPGLDGPNKDQPKGGQGKSQSYTLTKVFAGKGDERPAGFQMGKTVTVSINSNTSVPTTKFDIVVLRGNFGETVVAQKTVTRTGFVSFIVPANDTYRIRVINRGPGIAATCIVNVRAD